MGTADIVFLLATAFVAGAFINAHFLGKDIERRIKDEAYRLRWGKSKDESKSKDEKEM